MTSKNRFQITERGKQSNFSVGIVPFSPLIKSNRDYPPSSTEKGKKETDNFLVKKGPVSFFLFRSFV
jgi:hypothetical protein